MSGPSIDEQICYNGTDEMATKETVRKIRELADYVEDHARETREHQRDFENREHVAELLRAKADKIEAALRVIESETQMDNFKSLLKAIQWAQAGDYGTVAVQEQWDKYAEEITINVEK